jgi:hypothetical protein
MLTRREFVKNAGVFSAVAALMPSSGCNAVRYNNSPTISQSLKLKGFDDEQEESPSMVSDGNGGMWISSLRRLSYPKNKELVSSFRFDGKSWTETNPVTKSEGQYEAPAAACATGGKPVVAWTEKKDEDWVINAALMKAEGVSDPYTFGVKSGRSINPVLIAPNKNQNWIAWENLHNGKFTIYISKYRNGRWSEAVIIDKGKESCFDPGIAEAGNGDLYIAYGLTDGYHQNIEMAVLDGETLRIKESIPVAVGGGHKNRVNINARPALAFDAQDRLWISYESNRNANMPEDGDSYAGDRCCAILSYQDGKIVEVKKTGKWLFSGENDHKPSFFKDIQGRLYLATHCGGNFEEPFWQYRVAWLGPPDGWQKPVTVLKTEIKGPLIPPAIAFDGEGSFWFATCLEKTFLNHEPVKAEGITRSRLSELNVMQFAAPQLSEEYKPIAFGETRVEEYRPDEQTISTLSGHPRMERSQMTADGETYTLIYGNLHEHSNSSQCWPAGTDGTLHEDYRFGMFSEGYDFMGMTDHATSTSEVHWRRNIRLADFYNESDRFIAIPAVEWTLASDPNLDGIQYGAGHYNVVFAGSEDARIYIRNRHEIYSPGSPESKIAPMLWKMLDEKGINCVTIPHHSADKVHPVDWNVTDPRYVTVVEIFQCRGNNEYLGCPRQMNLTRHRLAPHKRGFIDYALRTKKHRMGFVASGDHNNMGVGVAALWVKEVSRAGIIEALQNRRAFATTGDKMVIMLKVNGSTTDAKAKTGRAPDVSIEVKGQRALDKVEILRNSEVIKEYKIANNASLVFNETFVDEDYRSEKEVLYYYVRVTQRNNEIGWSSPIWIEPG